MKKRILIVDDSDTSRNSLSFLLKIKNFDVIQAGNAIDALAQLESESTDTLDLIITDINMPGLSGLEMIKKIRQLEKFKFIPILVISSEEEEIKKSIEVGASAWLMKSSKTNEQLFDTINKII